MSEPKKNEFLDDIMTAAEEEARAADDAEDEARSLDDLAAEEVSEEDEEVSELDMLRAERDEFRDRFMRALADAENARKRSEKDRREAEQYGGSKLSRDMLPVYDNMKRALEAANGAANEGNSALIEGIELTMRELLNVFSRHGITLISPQVGDQFDPKLHQAMFEAPVPGTKAGEIIDVASEGFMLHDRLLRPASVGVSSNTGT